MAVTVHPFLMFEGRAEEAIELWVSLLPGSEIREVQRYGAGEQGPEGSLKLATVAIAGQVVKCFNSPSPHEFGFTPSFSFFVECGTEEELRRIAGALGEGGTALMPLGNYGFSRLFTWLNDRFGVSWQLNLA